MRLSAFRTIREEKTIAAICFGIVCVMFVAGFWPFKLHPANHVTWLTAENGLHFSGGGILLSSRRLQFPSSETRAGTSLEIWLGPSQEKYDRALLSISSPDNPEQFRLRQGGNSLLIFQQPFGSSHHTGMTWLWVLHVFNARSRFVTISSGNDGTTVYLDGVPAERSLSFKITQKDLSGQLIVGTSPVVYDTWRGELLGLALFGRELTATQVSEHYQAWLNGRPETVKSDQPAALYIFGERSGNVVQNQIPSGTDLIIPAKFSIPYKPFLKLPWAEFYPNLAYFREVLVNVAGFVPFGFFFCMLFSLGQPGRKSVVTTIILGTIFSLTIEVLQGFIPRRDSGTTDILTNTLGTALGAMLFRGGTLEALLGGLESRTSPKPHPD